MKPLISIVLTALLLGSSLAVEDPTAITSGTADSLRAAIEDLSKSFGPKYPRGGEFLERLSKLPPGDAAAFEQLQHEALLANPLVSGRPILFVNRPQYVNEHGPDETMYQSNEHNVGCFRGGASFKLLDPASGRVQTILSVTNGIARDPILHFNGHRLLFSMRHDSKDDFHLYEINTDGSGLKQLTSAPKVTDIQPVYLPDGKIMFSSTREPKYIHCQRHLMASLFLMEGDGANIRQVGFNTLFEGRNSLMPDGRVLYSRWEYVDKHFSSAYGLWTANPDGTAQQLYYGGLAWQPGAILDGRIIPGTQRALCIFGSVHDNEWGAMVMVDPTRGNDGPKTIVQSWPADLSPYLKGWRATGRMGDYDSFRRVPLKYQNPQPLSEKYFLCSRTLTPKNREMALFLVDAFGNEVLLHRESPGCFQPLPIAPQPKPPVIINRTDYSQEEGTFYIYDVYRGPGMDQVKLGSVKSIRIVEASAKLTYPPNGHGDWSAPGDGESHHPTALNWNHYNSKRILGTVPVEIDGSANFKVPAGRFVHFQLLDKNGQMIHSMRSGTALLPGERQGCIGCHDYHGAPPSEKPPLALQRPPCRITPWPGPAGDFSYVTEVQPILDRHCVRCHDYGKESKLVLSGDLGPVFNASYVALMSHSPAIWSPVDYDAPKPLISSIGSGPLPPTPPYSWGSHRSRLVDLLKAGHQGVKLSTEELDRIITWIDLNIPYYADYADYYSANTYGRCPLDHKQLLQLGALILAAPGGKEWGWKSVTDYVGGPINRLLGRGELPINFTRPELSACLRAFPDKSAPGYAEALGLITAGRELLKQHPRADMPGFLPCIADQEKLAWHEARQKIEQQNHQAIREGKKLYDPPAANVGVSK